MGKGAADGEIGLRRELSKTGARPAQRWREKGGQLAMVGTETGPSLSSEVAKPSAAIRGWCVGERVPLGCGKLTQFLRLFL